MLTVTSKLQIVIIRTAPDVQPAPQLVHGRVERVIHLLDALPPTGRRVLDAGCGQGRLVVELSRRGCAVSGFDEAPAMVAATRGLLTAEHLRGEIGQADGEHLPFPDAAFDVVTALGYLETFSDPTDAVAELTRVARPGAHLVLTAPCPRPAASRFDLVGAARAWRHPVRGYRRRYHRPAALRRLLEAAGLTVVHQEDHDLGPIAVAHKEPATTGAGWRW